MKELPIHLKLNKPTVTTAKGLTAWGIAGIVSALLIGVSLYHIIYANRIIPGTKIAHIPVGGLTQKQALTKLQKYIDPNLNIHVIEGSRETIIKADELQTEYDLDTSIQAAFNLGRTGHFMDDSLTKVQCLTKTKNLPLELVWDKDIVKPLLQQKLGIQEVEPRDATFQFEGGILKIVEESPGHTYNFEEINQSIDTALKFQTGTSITIKEKALEPVINAEDLEGIQNTVLNIIQSPIKIKAEDKSLVITPEEHLKLLEIVKDPKNQQTRIQAEETEVAELAENVISKLEEPPRGHVTIEENGQLDVEIVKPGWIVKREGLTNILEKTLNREGVTEVVVPVREISKEDISNYGIKELIGKGESSFRGSDSARIHNLTLATQKASGVIVPPGEIFSLSQAIGDITSETGFKTAWIISNGRTQKGIGGGVCQVSTTVFRAILNSGLPVIERHAHSYRVGYYEQDQPVGFDAAVFPPKVDLKFKNDTENYVLVQGHVNKDEYKIVFEIFGTDDGREVEISKPEIYNVSPPPPAKYIETDTLPKGTTKQIDFPAWGATSVFKRTVKKNGDILFEETYKSVYRPWQAIYLVGTKD